MTPSSSTGPDRRRGRYDAVVVGTGVGGAVSAALLAKAGLRVLSLERKRKIGGVLTSHERDGFKVDRAGHLLSRGARGPFGWLWRELAIEHPRFITHRMPMRSRGFLNLAAPDSRFGLMRAARELGRRLGLGFGERGRLGRLLLRMFAYGEPELQLLDQVTLETYLMNRIHHPATYYLFTSIANVLFLLPPWQLSAGEAIRTLRWMFRDYSVSYVEGGLDQIPQALLGVVTNSGGDVVTNGEVVSIRRSNGDFVTSTENGDEYRSQLVVANTGPREALEMLDDVAVPSYYRSRVADIEPSGSVHTLRLGLARPVVDEGCMVGGLSWNGTGPGNVTFETLFDLAESLSQGEVPDPLAIMAPVPTNFDPSLAPDGRQLLVANIYAPTTKDGEGDPPSLWKNRALDALERAIPGLSDEIMFEEFRPIANDGGIPNGQLAGQVGDSRLPVTTPIPGFYITGGGAGGRGMGLELAASSALEAYFAISAKS